MRRVCYRPLHLGRTDLEGPARGALMLAFGVLILAMDVLGILA